MNNELIPTNRIEQKILEIRGQKIIVDADLAAIYGTSTKRLNQAIRRNLSRFPIDFMFQLTIEEKMEVVTICDHLKKLKYSPHLPFVFTEHGALMAASILNTERAVLVSLYVVRAFVKMRKLVITHKELALKLSELERKVGSHDKAILQLMQTIKQLMEPKPLEKKKRIGF